IKLVAHVVSIQNLETNIVYLIDDSTGTIDARYWLHTSNPHIHADNDEKHYWAETSDYYARLIGILKSFRGRKCINVTFIETIQNPHEIFYHVLDVIHVNL
ncbi:hypothetical protein BGY98DRAFT_900282, partial [Russula aff. rugulosa BPL654]